MPRPRNVSDPPDAARRDTGRTAGGGTLVGTSPGTGEEVPADRGEHGTLETIADRGDAGTRLDRVVRLRLGFTAGLSRTRLQELVAQGQIFLNGVPASRGSMRVRRGDRIELVGVQPRVRAAPAAESLPIDVLFEDEHLLVVNKPAGMVAHPAYRHAGGTLINALLWLAREWPGGEVPLLAGRLDRLTSGLVVVARTPSFHAPLVRALSHARAEKIYLAVVSGRPDPARGRIDLRLMRDPADRRRVLASTWQGAEAETRYRVLARGRGPHRRLTLVVCRLLTGRMHQIRVHLAASGWPIVGDPVYGSPAASEDGSPEAVLTFPRQALHAWRVRFTHPVTGAVVACEAPLPADLVELLDAVGIRYPAPGSALRTP